MYRLMNPHWSLTHCGKIRIRERSDLMVECLTRDRRFTGSSLTYDTAAVCVLEQDTFISSKYCFNPGRPTWHDSKTQRINSNKQNSFNTYATEDWNNIYDSFHCKIKLPFLLLELTIARCSGLQMLSRLFHAHRHVTQKIYPQFHWERTYWSECVLQWFLQHINPFLSENIKKYLNLTRFYTNSPS